MNIIDGFLLHAKHQPTVAAICAPGWNYNIVSYGRLLVFANNAAAHALAAGLKRGDVVGILARDPIFHWALVLGLTQIGIVSFSLHDATCRPDFASMQFFQKHPSLQRFPPVSFVSIKVGSRAMAERSKPVPSMTRMLLPA